jgi:hypothetical protein
MSWLSPGCQIEGLVGLGVVVGKGEAGVGVGVGVGVRVGDTEVDVGAERAGRARPESRRRYIVGVLILGLG